MLKKIDGKCTQGDFLYFRDDGAVAKGRPTRKFTVFDRKSGVMIGYVKWFAPWRQYVFYPLNVALMASMMLDAADFCKQETSLQRDKRK